ncbi:MAG: c-type cytochrome [Thiobacillaceae bacterium]
MQSRALIASVALALALVACGKKEEAPPAAAKAPASDTPAAPPPATPAAEAPANPLVATGEAKYRTVCAVCHGQRAEGMGNYPRLAGQGSDEIRSKLLDYRAGKQMGPLTAIMAATAKGLSDEDIEALSAYIASLAP